MAARAKQRAAGRAAAEAAEEQCADAAEAPRHEGHHRHAEHNWFICSCGDPETVGVFTVTVDLRYWSDDPAERAQARREEDDFNAWISCRHCGRQGVIAGDVFGVWPPRRAR